MPQRLAPSLARDRRERRRSIGDGVRALREDAGISQRQLSSAADVSQSFLCAIEAGTAEASLELLARIAHPLGARVQVRLVPGAGPLVRDHLQAAMLEEMLAAIHPRWARFPEVVIHRPVRGMIDLVLGEPDANLLVAAEVQSQIRRLEAQLRWASEKAEALRTRLDLAPRGAGEPPDISRLLVLRSTPSTRTVAATYGQILEAAYPAASVDVLASLCGEAPWPGPGILWMVVERGHAHLIERSRPRGR